LILKADPSTLWGMIELLSWINFLLQILLKTQGELILENLA